jgi:hypothetical protein
MSHIATIRRRSGRHTKEHIVTLEKPAHAYAQSEQFNVMIDGREISVHVEIPIDEHFDTLCVA